MGKWGNGQERRKRLYDAGYNPSAVQSIVNALVEGDLGSTQAETDEVKISGTETMKIEIDLTKYNSLELTFNFGDT